MRQLFGWSLLVLLGVSACANLASPLPITTPAALSTSKSDPVILESTPTPKPTAIAKYIPKPNDLIFVEFFAVT